MAEQIIPIKSTTQRFIEITDIQKDIVLYVDGSCSMILSTTAVNFGLLSEKEQDAIIYAYAGLLNSLSFPVQILVRTQHKDISSYLSLLADQENRQSNPKLKASITAYRHFISSTVKEKDVLDKKFYVILPFSSLELGASPNVLFGSKKKGLPFSKQYIFEKASTVLSPKRDHIIRLTSRLGLRATLLTTEQLVKFFFSIYNPSGIMPGQGDANG